MPAPVQTETSTMPADDGLGFDDLKDIHPAGPEARQGSPEEPVQGVQRRTRSLALQNCQLLSKREDFEGDVAAILEEDPDGGEDTLRALGCAFAGRPPSCDLRLEPERQHLDD